MRVKRKVKRKSPKLLRGKALVVKVINAIIDTPTKWNQWKWHCGTQHCFGGFCQLYGAGRMATGHVRDDVRRLLKITNDVMDWVVAVTRTFPELYLFAVSYVRGKKPENARMLPDLHNADASRHVEGLTPTIFPKLKLRSTRHGVQTLRRRGKKAA